jgi:hypothetical protein
VAFRASLLVSLSFGGSETDLGLGLEVEGRSTIIRLEMAALSRSSFMDLLLYLTLRVVEGGWVNGYGGQLVDVFRIGRSISGCRWVGYWRVWGMRRFGLDIRGCSLGIEVGGPAGAVSSAGTMAGFAVLGRFHRRKVGRN